MKETRDLNDLLSEFNGHEVKRQEVMQKIESLNAQLNELNGRNPLIPYPDVYENIEVILLFQKEQQKIIRKIKRLSKEFDNIMDIQVELTRERDEMLSEIIDINNEIKRYTREVNELEYLMTKSRKILSDPSSMGIITMFQEKIAEKKKIIMELNYKKNCMIDKSNIRKSATNPAVTPDNSSESVIKPDENVLNGGVPSEDAINREGGVAANNPDGSATDPVENVLDGAITPDDVLNTGQAAGSPEPDRTILSANPATPEEKKTYAESKKSKFKKFITTMAIAAGAVLLCISSLTIGSVSMPLAVPLLLPTIPGSIIMYKMLKGEWQPKNKLEEKIQKAICFISRKLAPKPKDDEKKEKGK